MEKDPFVKSFDRNAKDFHFSPGSFGMPPEAFRPMSSMVRTRVLENMLSRGSDMNNNVGIVSRLVFCVSDA